jgi:hypothetical protein
MHIIFSSIIAQIGIILKQSLKVFHSFKLYLLLPNLIICYTHHKNHIFYWLMNTRDYLEVRRSSKDIWFYKQVKDKLFLSIVFLYQYNHLRTNSLHLVENLHIRIISINPEIVHVRHLNKIIMYHIF